MLLVEIGHNYTILFAHINKCKFHNHAPFNNKGSFTYYVISRGGGGFQMLTVDYGGGGGGGGGVLTVDYVIKILIFTLIPI